MCWHGRRSSNYLLVIALALLGCGGPTHSTGADGLRKCRGGKVWHSDEARRLRGCESIVGTLEIGGSLEETAFLEAVTRIDGDLVIGPSYQLTNLSGLASLREVSGDLRVEGNWRVSGLFLGKLERVGGAVAIHGNGELSTCALHTLRSFAELYIEGNSRLERVDLSGLPESGPGGMVGGKQLESVLAPARIDRELKAPTETPAKGS